MDKSLLDFISGNTNVANVNVIISKETLPNGIQYITIKHGDYEIFNFWHNPKKPVKKDKPVPKHTGGKKPYIMLMLEEVEILKTKGIKNVEELIGFLACLGKYIEWSTGKLVHGRGHAKKSLKYKHLLEIYSCGQKKLNGILGDLKEHDLLFSTEEGYFVSSKLIKKGKCRGQ